MHVEHAEASVHMNLNVRCLFFATTWQNRQKQVVSTNVDAGSWKGYDA